MTRYEYRRNVQTYSVMRGDRRIGECWRDRERPERPAWLARIYTDPTILGRGRTRDDAVDNVYQQTGGPDA